MNRTFGIEIECFGITQIVARDAIVAAGIDCRIESYNHETRPWWKIVRDATVPDGFELVSPILRGDDGVAAMRMAMDALRRTGARVDRRCGLHIHHGADDLTARDLEMLARRYARFETEIDGFVAPSRRGNENMRLRSIVPMMDLRDVQQRLQHDNRRVVCGAFGTRYTKVNLESMLRHGTVEFRHHGGTVEFEKAVAWLRFSQQFIAQSCRMARATAVAPLASSVPTKIARVLALISERAVSIEELMRETGWQRHTVRGAISTARSRHGLNITSERLYGTVFYRLNSAAVTAIAAADDHVFAGIDNETAAYLRRRAAHFATRERRVA